MSFEGGKHMMFGRINYLFVVANSDRWGRPSHGEIGVSHSQGHFARSVNYLHYLLRLLIYNIILFRAKNSDSEV